MNRILVVAAHPDDEILGCGAGMAKWSKAGSKIAVLILGEGITSRADVRNEVAQRQALNNLRLEAKAAHGVLGVKETHFASLPDNRFDSVDLLDIVKHVEKIISAFKPDCIVTHHGGDLNLDHRLTQAAVLTASRPIGTKKAPPSIRKILGFEVLSSSEWNAATAENAFLPTVFEDIAKFLPLKIKAMKQYKGELKEYPHPRSLEGIEILAKHRGLQVGMKAAEAFVLLRELRG